MANDALDPGPDGSYPYMPKTPDGKPDPVRMPTGVRTKRRKRKSPFGETHHQLDLTPRHPDGTPILPPPPEA